MIIIQAIIEKYNFFNLNMEINKRTNLKTICNIKCRDGFGVMTCYHVFPGIDLIFNDFHSYHCEEAHNLKSELIEINYCHKGRYESIFDGKKYEYLKEGDLSYNIVGSNYESSGFPMGYYEGCSILIDYSIAKNFFLCNYNDLNIDLRKMKRLLFNNNWYYIEKSKPEIENIFKDLYHTPSINKLYFYKLKVLEVLLFLSKYRDVKDQEKTYYYTKEQVDLIKDVRDSIFQHYNKKMTVKELSKIYNVSTTFLQNGFKDILGKTVAEYIREFRIYKAAKMIKETNQSIMEIALCVGYDNPSKFASAFKKVMGSTPLKYRKNF
ncbi:helix-turn-helix domain-containing protein [Clostridium weizhouense]|uniref:Helix-turn-helix transcriptional regulator n=1 Tax=Clostridium weizhouense TaxID=2859781 RepID=A0ABS7AL14_9CLOT|nr:helix-turn-helix transcriptional regulator [Clostridium weizhouense]MBW6409355.1 helix-turn-helix transcriptional regulator [Clostridium weizhouense]